MNQQEYKKFQRLYKIHDGIFIGELQSLYDKEIIQSNKITHVINAFYDQPFQKNEDFDLQYFNINCQEDENKIFNQDEYPLIEIYDFIQQAQKNCTSILIHSKNQYTAASTVLITYFMYKFRWSIKYSWDFINIKIKNIQKSSKYFKQLKVVYKFIYQLDESFDLTAISYEQQLFKNYYTNQQKNYFQQTNENQKKQKQHKVTFSEQNCESQRNYNMNKDLNCVKSNLKNSNSQIKICLNSSRYLESTRSKDSQDVKKTSVNEKELQENNKIKSFQDHMNQKQDKNINQQFFENYDHILKQNDYYIDLYHKYKQNYKLEKSVNSQSTINFRSKENHKDSSKDNSKIKHISPVQKLPLQPLNQNKKNSKYFSPPIMSKMLSRNESKLTDLSQITQSTIKSPSLKSSIFQKKVNNKSQKVLFQLDNIGKDSILGNKENSVLFMNKENNAMSFNQENLNIQPKRIIKKNDQKPIVNRIFRNITPNQINFSSTNSSILKSRDESLRSIIFKD